MAHISKALKNSSHFEFFKSYSKITSDLIHPYFLCQKKRTLNVELEGMLIKLYLKGYNFLGRETIININIFSQRCPPVCWYFTQKETLCCLRHKSNKECVCILVAILCSIFTLFFMWQCEWYTHRQGQPTSYSTEITLCLPSEWQ
jgi:hypothetical protein